MFSEDGKVSIVFNGEVYNFQRLRDELEGRGLSFETNSDTEVLLKMYLEYGESCINDLIGMFAVVIIDERVSPTKTVVFRDRLGIKPLYLYQDDAVIVSSEIKSILSLAKRKFTLDRFALSSYLSFRYPIGNRTFFKDIEQVPPGYVIIFSGGKLTSRKPYWKLSDKINALSRDEKKEEQEYLDTLGALFEDAVKLRMISDVPFGAFLSGGVDSSLVVAKMSELSQQPVKTFTIGFPNEGFNEFQPAKVVADIFKSEHREILIDQDDYFDVMRQLIQIKDAPLAVPNEVPLYLMTKELKKYITVVLSGEGADEIFAGYGRIFRSADDFQKQDNLDHDPELSAAWQKKYGDQRFESEVDHFYWMYNYVKPQEKLSLLNDEPDWKEIEEEFRDFFRHKFAEVPALNYTEKMQYVFETVHLQGLLGRVDTATMAASVEARVPFVDHRLVEFSFSIPTELKMKWSDAAAENAGARMLGDQISENLDTPKYILKEYASSYLPDEILYRKKLGFPVPLTEWFGADFASLARAKFADKGNPAYQYFNMSTLTHLVNNQSKSTNRGLLVWQVLNFYEFCDIYKDYIQ